MRGMHRRDTGPGTSIAAKNTTNPGTGHGKVHGTTQMGDTSRRGASAKIGTSMRKEGSVLGNEN